MACLLVLLALFIPRVVILLLWLFDDWFSRAFDSWLLPVLGFIFMPVTLLWVSAVRNWMDGVWGIIAVAGLVVAVIIDLSSGGAARSRRRRWW